MTAELTALEGRRLVPGRRIKRFALGAYTDVTGFDRDKEPMYIETANLIASTTLKIRSY